MGVHAESLAETTEAVFRRGLLSATGKLRAFAWSFVGDRDRADDLVQDTIVRALRNRRRFEPGTNLQAWLFTIMRNVVYSERRKRWREVEDVDDVHASTLSTPAEQPGHVEFAQVRSALDGLPEGEREAVLLIGAEGLSYQEAAMICGTKVGTIKSRVHRARTRLARLLGYQGKQVRS